VSPPASTGLDVFDSLFVRSLCSADEGIQKERDHSQRGMVGKQKPVSAQHSLNNSSAWWRPSSSKSPVCVVVDLRLVDHRVAKRFAQPSIEAGLQRSGRLASRSISRIELQQSCESFCRVSDQLIVLGFPGRGR
jgi:hypothetical protein